MQITPMLTEAAGPNLAPYAAARHPLAATARREGLSVHHLAVAAGPPVLPLLLLRAEVLPNQAPQDRTLALRVGLLADAGHCPASATPSAAW